MKGSVEPKLYAWVWPPPQNKWESHCTKEGETLNLWMISILFTSPHTIRLPPHPMQLPTHSLHSLPYAPLTLRRLFLCFLLYLQTSKTSTTPKSTVTMSKALTTIRFRHPKATKCTWILPVHPIQTHVAGCGWSMKTATTIKCQTFHKYRPKPRTKVPLS